MERELTIERTRAGLDVARQLGRKGGRKQQMTESKIKSAKKLLASGVPPRDVASNLGVSVPTLTAGFPPPATLCLLYCPFSDETPARAGKLPADRALRSVHCRQRLKRRHAGLWHTLRGKTGRPSPSACPRYTGTRCDLDRLPQEHGMLQVAGFTLSFVTVPVDEHYLLCGTLQHEGISAGHPDGPGPDDCNALTREGIRVSF